MAARRAQPHHQPPEYVKQGNISIKTDAYAYGMVLFELLTGKRTNSCDLHEFICEHMEGTDFASALDSRVPAAEWPVDDALAVARVGDRLQEQFPRKRPSVAEVLPELEALLQKAARGASEGL